MKTKALDYVLAVGLAPAVALTTPFYGASAQSGRAVPKPQPTPQPEPPKEADRSDKASVLLERSL